MVTFRSENMRIRGYAMRQTCSIVGLVLGGLVVFGLGTPVRGATVSLKAIEVNGVPLPSPTNAVTVEPGDTILTQAFISGWGALAIGNKISKPQSDSGFVGFHSNSPFGTVKTMIIIDHCCYSNKKERLYKSNSTKHAPGRLF